MQAIATTTLDERDEVEAFMRDSGCLTDIQQQGAEAGLRHHVQAAGFDLLHVSHRHNPALQITLSDQRETDQELSIRLWRLFRSAGIEMTRPAKIYVYRRKPVLRVWVSVAWD